MPDDRNRVSRRFAFVAQFDAETLVVTLEGELDMAATFKLESELERLWARHEIRRLEIDLAKLAFVDSAGLGALLAIRDRTQDLGIQLRLTNPSDPVRRILDLSGTAAALLD